MDPLDQEQDEQRKRPLPQVQPVQPPMRGDPLSGAPTGFGVAPVSAPGASALNAAPVALPASGGIDVLRRAPTLAPNPASITPVTPRATRPGDVTPQELQAVSPHGLRKALGLLSVGAAAFGGGPRGGEQARESAFEAPKERLLEQRGREQKSFDTQEAQQEREKQLGIEETAAGLQNRNIESEIANRTSEIKERETPVGKAPKTEWEGFFANHPNPSDQEIANFATQIKAPEAGGKPLTPAQIDAANARLAGRWKVNGKGPIPHAYVLLPGATEKEYQGIDADLKSLDAATGTKAQREQADAARDEARAASEAARTEREETNEMKWAEGTDPKTGRTIAGPVSELKKAGATDLAALERNDVSSIRDARRAVQAITKTGTKPEQQGVLQLIDGLDKDGKLGVAASRLNSFLAGGVGTSPGDDPRIITLLDKGQLALTLTMKAHFGVSGGRSPQMLQHFLDMANAKKMDATTLRAGFRAINDYMGDRAEMPETGAVNDEVSGAIAAFRKNRGK